jgi:methylthioribulose-1-phosphate dehydratase
MMPRSAERSSVVDHILTFESRAWTAATSSNFSYREEKTAKILISRSGLDKQYFTENDFLEVGFDGLPVREKDAKPSAETLIHTTLYAWDDNIKAVYHTHSPLGTALTYGMSESVIHFTGLEILKAFRGIKTHEAAVDLKIFPNTQDMPAFAEKVKQFLFSQNRETCFGFYLAGHGLYTWGDSPAEAKRHLEAWEFLIEVKTNLIRLGK